MEVSERPVCKTVDQLMISQRYKPKQPDKDKALVSTMKQLAKEHPSYGYRFITAKLRQKGWQVSHNRVQRIC